MNRMQLGAAGAAALLATSAFLAGCGSNRLDPNPVPKDSAMRPLPAWYPEKPWTAGAGESRIYIEGKIVFQTDRAVIRPESEKVLQTLLQFTKEHPEVTRLRIEGHTDSTAGDEYNMELSAKRALAVCNWLVDHGVEPTRLMAVGFGETKPIGPNDTAAGRSENRRTEFHVAEVRGRAFGNAEAAVRGGMVLDVLSADERKKKDAAAKGPPPKPAPEKPFVPTGNEIKPVVPGAKAPGKPDPSPGG